MTRSQRPDRTAAAPRPHAGASGPDGSSPLVTLSPIVVCWSPRVVAFLGLVLCGGQPSVGAEEYTDTAVTFRNGQVELAGTLVLPGSKPPHPAIIFLHGSGDSRRDGFLEYAHRYAALGFASIAFDKRGCGKSGGDWKDASLDDHVRDARAAADYLRGQASVDPKRIGLWGVSQAGWVASAAFAGADEYAFLVIICGGGVGPRESERFAFDGFFKRSKISGDDLALARRLLDAHARFIGSGEGRSELDSLMAESRKRSWFGALGLERKMPESESARLNWAWTVNYDPIPDIARIRVPVLLLFGGLDNLVPVEGAVTEWRRGLNAAGNTRVTVRIFPEAGHGIRLPRQPGQVGRAPFASGYHETIDQWLSALFDE